jgi:hypothetical protein
MERTRSYRLGRTLLPAIILFAASTHVFAVESSFREEFTTNYKAQRFQQQVILVKKNKDIIADEIRSLIDE